METQVIDTVFSFDKYPIELKERDGIFYLLCSTLGVVESDSNIEKAYAKLNEKRKKVLADLRVFGIVPEVGSSFANFRTTLSSRISKYIIITTLLLIPVGLVAGYGFIINKINHMIISAQVIVKQKISSALSDPSNIAIVLNKAADTLDKVAPERKEEIQLTLRRISTSLKPFADELKPLYLADK